MDYDDEGGPDGLGGDAAPELVVCGACNFIDATLAGCESCGATAEDMMGWYL
jgi:hypothetical protein